MYYVSGFDSNLRCWEVTDTSDNSVEKYSFKSLIDIKNKCKVNILGVGLYCTVCKRVGDFLFVRLDYFAVRVYSVSKNCLLAEYSSIDIHHPRNDAYITDFSITKQDGDLIYLRLECCIKFDIEFTGLHYVVFDMSSRRFTRSLDTVYFICDSKREKIETEIQHGDCPHFITSDEFKDILLFKGFKL